jgi:predicted RNA-binding Zn-ribbon protein involved in translation (DUF1610 family)
MVKYLCLSLYIIQKAFQYSQKLNKTIVPKNQMEDYSEGDYDKVEITCPNCGNSNVAICRDEFGYFKVILCHNCGYKDSKEQNKECK